MDSQTTYDELRQIAARYPEARSGLLPMLHLVQSAEGRITPEGIEACAEILGISAAEVSGVATFYTMYKRKPGRRLPRRRLHQHAVRGDGRRRDLRAAQGPPRGRQRRDHRPDGKITLEHIECNAACDYAPVMTVNWEFMDNMTPQSATAAGRRPARRAPRSARPAAPASAPGARPSACSPASPTTAPTRARPPAPPRWSAWASRARTAGPRRSPRAARAVTRRSGVPQDRGRDRRHRRAPRPRRRSTSRPPTPSTRQPGQGGRRQVTDMLTPVLTDNWDEDRSWTLESYEARGGYRRARQGAGHGPGRRDRGGQGVRPARPRRRRLPDRHEVGLHPAGQPASRSTSSSTPTSPSRAPARTSR